METVNDSKVALVLDEQKLAECLEQFIEFVNELLVKTTEDCSKLEQKAAHIIEILDREIELREGHALLSNVSRKDESTFIHSLNVAMLSYDIAKWNGFSKSEREKAALCGLLHDVGKLAVPDAVLLKRGCLTLSERDIIRQHALQGYFTLWSFGDKDVKLTAVQHHERYDGTGYPFGLKGEEINIYAQICSIADVYDAMTSDRIYRRAEKPEDVLEYMEKEYCRYSPIYLPRFIKRAREIMEVPEKKNIVIL